MLTDGKGKRIMSAPVISVHVRKLNFSICQIVYNNWGDSWEESGCNCSYFGDPSVYQRKPGKLPLSNHDENAVLAKLFLSRARILTRTKRCGLTE